MNKRKHLLFLEIVIKVTIIFIVVHFINKRMEYYIIDNHGTYWYYSFVIMTNLIGFAIGQMLARARIYKEIKRECFTKHYNDCIEMYNTFKKRIADKNSIELIEPNALIHAIAIHEFIISEYNGKNEESTFLRLKSRTIKAMTLNQIELVLKGVNLLLTSLNNTQFDVKLIEE